MEEGAVSMGMVELVLTPLPNYSKVMNFAQNYGSHQNRKYPG
jgi:hypothetical protein